MCVFVPLLLSRVMKKWLLLPGLCWMHAVHQNSALKVEHTVFSQTAYVLENFRVAQYWACSISLCYRILFLVPNFEKIGLTIHNSMAINLILHECRFINHANALLGRSKLFAQGAMFSVQERFSKSAPCTHHGPCHFFKPSINTINITMVEPLVLHCSLFSIPIRFKKMPCCVLFVSVLVFVSIISCLHQLVLSKTR